MKNIKEYVPINGFFDLRKYDLTVTEFLQCWRLQEEFSMMQKSSQYIKTYYPEQWKKAQEYSAQLQSFLFERLKKAEV